MKQGSLIMEQIGTLHSIILTFQEDNHGNDHSARDNSH